jgi:tRNA(His) guanylyltransferase
MADSKAKSKSRIESLGDRMKVYEGIEASRAMMPRLPILARLDGRAFHTFTRGLERPYDRAFSGCMIRTMQFLVEKFHADLAYTQSDEIMLYWENSSDEMMFGGRFQKWHSVLASTATLGFVREVQQAIPSHAHKDMTFDCRVWQVPYKQEVYHNFLWREDDATKNSVSMAAQSMFSHKELLGKKGPEM